ncbi:MAG: tetratricopeptide repeat protein [Ferruginibacter sp.]|nr:tetratricopeptide repeat protein [Ferruginibacter sp.]
MDRIQKLLEFLKQSEGDSFLQHALALEYVKIGKDTEALHLFNNVIQNDPGYVGSYYQLGKLLEKMGQIEKALEIYNAGMDEAKKAGDKHSYNELMGAKDEIEPI